MSKHSSSPHPQWALKHKQPGTELRLINGRYYLYAYKTVYDALKKKPKKVSGKLLGSISETKGFMPSPARLAAKAMTAHTTIAPVLVKEYGVAQLVITRFTDYSKRLEKYFGEMWKELIAIAYCRIVYKCPLKSIPFRLDSSYLPELLGIHRFNEKTASGVLNKTGGMPGAMQSYMKAFIEKGDYILMDATHVLSQSEQIAIARKGYNAPLNFEQQFNLLYVYSATQRMPVFYRLLPGNVREVKAFKNTLLQAGLKKAIIVADKGFYSEANRDLLLQEKLDFILPLKRNNALIDYNALSNNTFKTDAVYFEHEKRAVWHHTYKHEKLLLHLYLDETLRLKEESDYIGRIKTHPENYSIEKYHQHRNHFGTIALLTNLYDASAQDVYETYKSRMYIETMFDGMKNVLEADHTYMQNQQTLEGWMFINHICLQWYQHLFIELKTKNLLKKISVNDYIQLLTDVKKVKINNTWHLNEYTAAAKKLMQALDINI
ncbi:transposase [Parafilimonas sp.]|uniref:transposase n=1 Tax=Parafilimonas sp. TaxID=1969739 RepID=UPI0039E412F5